METKPDDVARKLQEKEYPFPSGHAAQQERDRDWSVLGRQVVALRIIDALISR